MGVAIAGHLLFQHRAGTPGLIPGETLSPAGGWLGNLAGASPMVAAPAP